MSMRLKIRNAETGSVVDMMVEPENRIEEIIESAAYYWEKEPNAYILRKGRNSLRGQVKVVDAGISHSDILELFPDPESREDGVTFPSNFHVRYPHSDLDDNVF